MPTPDELATKLEFAAREFLSATPLHTLLAERAHHATKSVKLVFGQLGKSLGYEVAAAGFSDADDGEWLYDMTWYQTKNGLMIHQAMVLECEWRANILVNNNADVDGDFQKLVQARADVRVWVSTCPNQDFTRRHIANCKEQISAFSGTLKDDQYIFVINDWTSLETVVERYAA